MKTEQARDDRDEVIRDSGGGRLMDALRPIIEAELDKIEARAQEVADQFWARHWEIKRTRPPSERGYLGVRVRRRDLHVAIEWFRVRYGGGKRKGTPLFEYLRRGKGYAYPKSAFSGAWCKDWEREMAMELEEQFARLRQRVEMLTRMARYAREYDRRG